MKKRYTLQLNTSKLLGKAVLLVGLIPGSLGASTISHGHFDIAGTLFVTDFRTTAVVTPAGTCPASAGGMACIFWQDPTGNNIGKIDISNSGLPNGDIPAAISGNDAANISSLSTPPENVGGAGFTNSLFMTFNNAGITTQLMLNFIDPGIYSAAACAAAPVSGQQCTLPGSLFNLANTPPPSPGTPCGAGCQATATWVFEGVTAGNPSFQSEWTGNFTSQFPFGSNYQSIFAQLQSQGFVSNTFSATITLTAVPEPGTIVVMIGAGLVGLSLLLRRRHTAK